ncbi:SRPBCC family protein [Sulfitobacter sp. G21635-S1]|uniref:SRPBCC family protein n=1 Tax=Sulfitobacter sp. G21635-S1 TaxID=3014043 RepID=UPI0022AF949F|nr:SRPBCC family protein [Sulfitobacter sp. G21635-S1]MCZ4253900.1 SRPBCC family protein [Sulfitobacter sp. G21635-S1]
MTEVVASGVIDADADTVWMGLRDFSGPARWVRNIVTSDIEGEDAVDQVGAIRRLVFDSGNELCERLIALSDRERYFRYALLPPTSLPIQDYSGKVQVIPITDGNRALVHWCGSFTIREGAPEEVRAWVRSIYQRDIEDMQAYFEGL